MIYLIGLAVVGVCIILVGNMVGGNPGIYLPIMLGLLITSVPFFYALYQGLNLLSYIDKNTAFSDSSIAAIQKIKYCAFSISILYALLMPFIIYVADKDDAPGAPLVALVIMSAFFVTGVFVEVLQRLFQSAMDIKKENDLTV